MITHLRVWNNSKYYIKTACGIEVSIRSKRDWRWTDIHEEVNCKKCRKDWNLDKEIEWKHVGDGA